jgi:hypothetical protein
MTKKKKKVKKPMNKSLAQKLEDSFIEYEEHKSKARKRRSRKKNKH